MSLPADYHIHTHYCGHAHGATIQYVEKAMEKGLKKIGFADHLGRYYLSQSQKKKHWSWGMKDEDLEKYFEEISSLRENYRGKIEIKIGLEVDYIEGSEKEAERILTSLPFDFALASVHCLPRFGWKHLARYADKLKAADLYKEYFKTARAALNCGVFQSLAHLDFIWRYIPWPLGQDDMVISDIKETVCAAALSTTALEINSNGYLWSKTNNVKIDPFNVLLDQIASRGVTVSLGSDAHEPDTVGNHFEEMVAVLSSKGISSSHYFG